MCVCVCRHSTTGNGLSFVNANCARVFCLFEHTHQNINNHLKKPKIQTQRIYEYFTAYFEKKQRIYIYIYYCKRTRIRTRVWCKSTTERSGFWVNVSLSCADSVTDSNEETLPSALSFFRTPGDALFFLASCAASTTDRSCTNCTNCSGKEKKKQNRKKNRTEKKTEQKKTEQKKTEQKKTEQKKTEQKKTEQNRTEQNRTHKHGTTKAKCSAIGLTRQKAEGWCTFSWSDGVFDNCFMRSSTTPFVFRLGIPRGEAASVT